MKACKIIAKQKMNISPSV